MIEIRVISKDRAVLYAAEGKEECFGTYFGEYGEGSRILVSASGYPALCRVTPLFRAAIPRLAGLLRLSAPLHVRSRTIRSGSFSLLLCLSAGLGVSLQRFFLLAV